MTRPVLAAWMLAAAVACPAVAAASTEAQLIAELEAEAERSAPSAPTDGAPSGAIALTRARSTADEAAALPRSEPIDYLDPVEGPGSLTFASEEESSVRLHGFIAVELSHGHDGASTGSDASTFSPQFHLAPCARIAHRASVFGEIEYGHGEELRVDRAFFEVLVAPWLTLRAGLIYVPVSYERLHYYAPVRLTTTRPLLAEIAFDEWSDAGIEASGRYRSLSWNLALVNGPAALSEGEGKVGRLRDNNGNKALAGRVSYQPFQGLETGVGAAYGRYDREGRLAFRNVELDARLRRGRLDVWFEYDRRDGDDEPCAFDGSSACDALFTGARAGRHGAYLLGAYSVVERRPWIQYLKPLARVEFVEELNGGGRRYRTTAGLAWSPLPHVVAKTEYGRTEDHDAAPHHDVFVSLTADF